MARTSIIIIMYTRYISENRYEVCLHVCVLYACVCACVVSLCVLGLCGLNCAGKYLALKFSTFLCYFFFFCR